MSSSDRESRETTILIIEDDDATVDDLQDGLISAGYVVPRVGSAGEALGTLRSRRADLILMGLVLPDADGLMLCASLKAQFHVPIIVLTASLGEVDRALALESGAIDCLTKPVDRNELVAQVKAVVHASPTAPARQPTPIWLAGGLSGHRQRRVTGAAKGE